jgi:DNA-binding transcriptional LysR family regulator
MEEGIDLSVQTGELHDSSLAVRRLATAGYAVCASPAYFKRHGRPATPQDLRQHTCIAYRRPRTGRIRDWRFRSGAGVQHMPVSSPLTFNRIELLIEAAIAGYGLIQIPECYAQQAIARGALAATLEEYRAGGCEISAVYRQQRRRAPNERSWTLSWHCSIRHRGDRYRMSGASPSHCPLETVAERAIQVRHASSPQPSLRSATESTRTGVSWRECQRSGTPWPDASIRP